MTSISIMSSREIASAQEVIESYDVDAKKAMLLINERAKDTAVPFRAYDAAHAICSALVREKLMNIADIVPYTGSVSYEVDMGGRSLQNFIEEQAREEGIDLDPDFQRGHVWSSENQTRYIEHLLRGGTTSRTLIWNCPGYDQPSSRDQEADAPSEMVIVDGKQRLTAILGFINNEVPVFDGHLFKDFDEQSQRDFMSPTGRLRVHMAVHALTRRRELLQLYIELNEGAIAHSPDEIARVKSLRDASAPTK